MNWTANISKTEWVGGNLVIYIDYINGDQTKTITEQIAVANAQTADWLQSLMSQRINQLSALESFEQLVTSSSLSTSVLSVNPINGTVTLTADTLSSLPVS